MTYKTIFQNVTKKQNMNEYAYKIKHVNKKKF